MLPLDPQGLREATTGRRPHGGLGARRRTPTTSADRVARLGLAVAALALCLGAGTAGVVLGSALQTRVEARPDASETRALDALSAPERNTGPVDSQRGPNRADLGGGR